MVPYQIYSRYISYQTNQMTKNYWLKMNFLIFFFQINVQVGQTGTSQTDYCVGYRCVGDEGWRIGFQVCVCPDEKVMKEMVKEVRKSEVADKSGAFKKDELCCDPTILTKTEKDQDDKDVGIDCPKKSDDQEENKWTCAKNEWKVINIGEYDSTQNPQNYVYESRCIGTSWPGNSLQFQQGLVMNAFECKGGPCGDTNGTCIR